VEVEEQLSGDIVRALVDGIADIGVYAAGTPAHGLDARPFRSDELVVLCPKGHPLARSRRVAFRDCLRYDFVGLNRGSSLLELTSRAAEDAGNALRLRVQVRSFDAMCHMIAAGLGIGVAPLAVCRSQIASLGLKAIKLSDSWASRQLVITSKAREGLSAAATSLLAHLQGMREPH
jgi:DNA-binding transcriptional LysR family regulator